MPAIKLKSLLVTIKTVKVWMGEKKNKKKQKGRVISEGAQTFRCCSESLVETSTGTRGVSYIINALPESAMIEQAGLQKLSSSHIVSKVTIRT